MPKPETSHRLQWAVLWPAAGYDEYGQPKRGEPVEVRVRWEYKDEETVDPKGDTISINAVVVVDRVIAVDSTMWLGRLSEWYGTGSAGDDSELMRVATYNETPDVKSRVARRTVGLKRFRDTLPPNG